MREHDGRNLGMSDHVPTGSHYPTRYRKRVIFRSSGQGRVVHPLASFSTLLLTLVLGITTATRIRDELFHPVVILNAIVAFYVVGPAWKLVLLGDYRLSHANADGQLAQTLAVVILSYLGILWAYKYTGPDSSLPSLITTRDGLDRRTLLFLGLAGFGAGVLFYLYYVIVNGGFVHLVTVTPRTAFSGPDTVRYRFLGLSGIFAGMVTVLTAYRPRVVQGSLNNRDYAVLGGVLVVTFLVAISLRSRMNIVLPAGYLLLYADGTDRLPRRHLVAAGGALFVFGVGYTFLEALFSAREANPVLILVGGLLSTIRLEVLMETVTHVPEVHPYQHGATFLRSFGISWPGAPLTYGNQLEIIIRGEDTRYISFPALVLGELWLNFGLLGVLSGSVVFGWALRSVSSLRHLTRSTIAMGIYPLVFLGVISAYPTSIGWAFRSVWIRVVLPVAVTLFVAQRMPYSALPLPETWVLRQREE